MIGPVHNRVARRLTATAVIAAAIAGSQARAAGASLFFLFEPSNARPGETVVVRTGGTSRRFTLADRATPFQKPISIYLVSNQIADQVHSRHDARLVPVGVLVADKNGHGVLAFKVPKLKADAYAAAAWCPGCASYSRGRTFLTVKVDRQVLPRYRRLMLLRVRPSTRRVWPWMIAAGLVAISVAVGAVRLRSTRGSA
jgi:hypothetical protein